MRTVIVTGATSMLGIATIQECIKNNVRVTALLRPGSRRKVNLPESELLTLIECDISELEHINIPKENYDILYHFGWGYTDRTNRDDPVLQSKNIKYTLDAVQLAYKYGCKKFFGAGSQAEYGFHDEIITEKTPVNPAVCYGYAKYAAGKLAEKLCDKLGIICIWARIFSVYGLYDGENTMISYAIRQYRENKIAKFSPGYQKWDYLFEEDAGKYFLLLGERVTETTVVNIASGEIKPLRDYIAVMADVLNEKDKNRPFKYELSAEGNVPLRGMHPDVSRLRDITGYIPETGFAEGIRKIRDYC